MAFAGVGELHKLFKVKRLQCKKSTLGPFFFSGDNRLSIKAVFFFFSPTPQQGVLWGRSVMKTSGSRRDSN